MKRERLILESLDLRSQLMKNDEEAKIRCGL